MKYYSLSILPNLKVIGKYPQVNNGIFKTTWDSKNSLLLVPQTKIDPGNIEVPELILNERAKATDLLSVAFVSLKLVISDKLKKIIERKNYPGIQFFKTLLHKQNNESEDYWILNPFEFRNEYIDFSSSAIQCSSKDGVSYTKVDNLNAFNLLFSSGRKEAKIYFISTLSLSKSKIKEDFFLLKGVNAGVGYYVSEDFKKEIEQAGCTGIDFVEIGGNE